MNGLNSIRNGYNHFKTIATQNNDFSLNLKSGITTVLPSIANFTNVSVDASFNSYLNSDSMQSINSAVSPQCLTQYHNANGTFQYSLPVMRGFSTLGAQPYYSNSSSNTIPSNPTSIPYQYQEFNYQSLVPNRNWIESYSIDCTKPSSMPPFQVGQNSNYLSNGASPSNSSKDSKVGTSQSNIKDEKYSMRRQKNNIAAKKCRDNKKLKNQEVCELIMQYEKDNQQLKLEISSVKLAIEELMKQLH